MELAPSSQIMPINRMWMMIFGMFRSVWYFTSVDGTIKRKHKAKLDAECLGCAGARWTHVLGFLALSLPCCVGSSPGTSSESF